VSYVFEYTINSVGTWEYKTVTIAGSTSGNFTLDNTTGLVLAFSQGQGTTYATATVGSWVAGNFHGSTTETDLISNSGATWQITGVQLEVGDTATPFEHRSYGQELALCQRYYYQRDWTETAYEPVFMPTWCNSTSTQQVMFYHPVQMRSGPTCSHNGAGNFRVNNSTGQDETCNGIAFSNARVGSAVVTFTKPTANFTVGDSGYINTEADNDASFYIDAEL